MSQVRLYLGSHRLDGVMDRALRRSARLLMVFEHGLCIYWSCSSLQIPSALSPRRRRPDRCLCVRLEFVNLATQSCFSRSRPTELLMTARRLVVASLRSAVKIRMSGWAAEATCQRGPATRPLPAMQGLSAGFFENLSLLFPSSRAAWSAEFGGMDVETRLHGLETLGMKFSKLFRPQVWLTRE